MSLGEADGSLDVDPFWGTRKPGKVTPRAVSSSPARSKLPRQYVSTRLYSPSRRQVAYAHQQGIPQVSFEPEPRRPLVERGALKSRRGPGQKFVPNHQVQRFKPLVPSRSAVFREDLLDALKTEDMPLLLAMYGTALDLDARLFNTTQALQNRNGIDAIRKKLRGILAKRVRGAMKRDDLVTLQNTLEEVDSDRLLQALARFPELERARAYYNLRAAHQDVEDSLQRECEDDEHKDRVYTLEFAIKQAKFVEGLEEHVKVSEQFCKEVRSGRSRFGIQEHYALETTASTLDTKDSPSSEVEDHAEEYDADEYSDDANSDGCEG